MSRLCRYAWRLSPKNQLYTTHMLPALHSGKLRPPDASLQLKCTLNVQCHFLEQFGQNQIRNINELSNIGRIWNPTVQKPDFLKVPFWMIQFSSYRFNYLKTGPFKIQTKVPISNGKYKTGTILVSFKMRLPDFRYHSKSEHIWISDPKCLTLELQFHF